GRPLVAAIEEVRALAREGRHDEVAKPVPVQISNPGGMAEAGARAGLADQGGSLASVVSPGEPRSSVEDQHAPLLAVGPDADQGIREAVAVQVAGGGHPRLEPVDVPALEGGVGDERATPAELRASVDQVDDELTEA